MKTLNRNERERITAPELERMLKEAVNALQGKSLVLEKAPKMSKEQLQKEIDNRLLVIISEGAEGAELEQIKAEARTLAIIKLRRG